MWSTLGLVKILTNFNLSKFDELCKLMVPTIHAHTKGYWWDSHCGLATDQINFGIMIVPIHFIYETWQYCHVWHIPLDLDQVCYMQWCSFHCILHQFNIWQWDCQIFKNEWFLVHRSLSSKVVFDSLMGHSSRSKDPWIMPPKGCGSMDRKDVFYE
jgi:hypothetical protein